jgi:hypothetical protein
MKLIPDQMKTLSQVQAILRQLCGRGLSWTPSQPLLLMVNVRTVAPTRHYNKEVGTWMIQGCRRQVVQPAAL